MASKNASAPSPVSSPMAEASAEDVSGPVAMTTLSQSAGGRPAISPRSSVTSGWASTALFDGAGKPVAVDGERAPRRHLMRVG